jgi:hypothetical protein
MSSRRTSAGVRGQRVPVRLAFDEPRQHIGGVRAVESAAPGDELVQHAPERPDIGAAIDGLATRLLGRHVGGGAEDDAHVGGIPSERRRIHHTGRRRRAIQRERLGETEIEHLHRPVRPHHHIGRLQVAMDDALFVCRLERIGDLPCDRQRLGERDRSTRDDRRQVVPSTSSITRAFASRP